jgi:hypothetical protein
MPAPADSTFAASRPAAAADAAEAKRAFRNLPTARSEVTALVDSYGET